MWAAEEALAEPAVRARDDGHENETPPLQFFSRQKCGVISCQGLGLRQGDTHAVEPPATAAHIYHMNRYFIIYEHRVLNMIIKAALGF